MKTVSSNATMIDDPYYSRVQSRWEAAERLDPVIWDDRQGPLSAEQLETFENQGFFAFEQLVSPWEAEELLEEAHRLARRTRSDEQGVITEPNSDVVRSVFRVHRISERFRQIAKDPRLVETARQILGGDVYLHQSRINYKPPMDGKEFFWHSDFETWHVEDGMPRMRAVSISLSLTENTRFNGPLIVVPRSHTTYIRCVGETPEEHYRSSLKKQEYGVPSRDALEMLVDRGGMRAPAGEPGSAVMFDCNTMHASSGNLSPHARTNLFLVYNSVENALEEPFGGTPPRPDFLGEREVVPIDEI